MKIIGRLELSSEALFLGRRLRNNGDVFIPPKYIKDLLELCGMNKSNFSPTTGSSSLNRIVDADSPLTDSEHSNFQISNCCWQASLVSICEARLF